MTRRNAAWGLLALCTACLVLAASSVSTEQCRDGGSCASARPSVDFVTPLEGDAGQLTGADSVKVLLKIKDFEGSVGIYLDGKVTKWEKTAGGDLNTAVALGKSPSCGEWHMLEAVLMDAEGFRLENEVTSAICLRTCYDMTGTDAVNCAPRKQRLQSASIFHVIVARLAAKPARRERMRSHQSMKRMAGNHQRVQKRLDLDLVPTSLAQ
eukprot:3120649-Rhodomonas_salina.1